MKFIDDLSGNTQDFAIACFEQNDLDELEEPFNEDDEQSCIDWELTEAQWLEAVQAAKNELQLDELKKRYSAYQPELDEYAGLWLIYDNKHSQDIEGPGNELLAFGTFIEADNYINEMVEGLMESND